MFKIQNLLAKRLFQLFVFQSFVFVSDFDIRISNLNPYLSAYAFRGQK
jgi:hypothetical protein